MIYLYLFITFFKIGLFGFGGGYAMLSLIQNEVVQNYGWLTSGEFADIVAISQMTPGPIGINSATYCGYTAVHNAGFTGVMAVLGSFVATFAVVLPSFIIMLTICKVFRKHMKSIVIQSALKGLRPAILGLLGATTLMLMTKENFSSFSENPWQFSVSIFLFIAALYGVMVAGIKPIRMMVYCAVAGLLLFY